MEVCGRRYMQMSCGQETGGGGQIFTIYCNVIVLHCNSDGDVVIVILTVIIVIVIVVIVTVIIVIVWSVLTLVLSTISIKMGGSGCLAKQHRPLFFFFNGFIPPT